MRLGIILGIFLAQDAAAQSVCRVYEYAELRDMSRERLEQAYCEYRASGYAMLNASLADQKSGRSITAQRSQDDAMRCLGERERITRVLESKFAAKPPQCAKQ